MLDMGFAEDLEAILEATPAERQTALFSATLPPRIADIANKHLKDPVRVRIDREVVPAGRAPRVRQVAYIVPRAHKMATLGRVLDVEDPTSAIVFCRTRTEVDELTETLNGRGYRAEALHGGLSQEQRDRVMKKFRANTADLLVATDVAARGLDMEHVSHVVNYDVPSAPRPTCTASAAPVAPDAKAWRSRSPSRASTGCCATSSSRRGRRSRSPPCRRSPTCARAGSS